MSVVIEGYRVNVAADTVDIDIVIQGPYRTGSTTITVGEATLQALATARSAASWTSADVVAYVSAALTALAGAVSLA